MWLLTVSMFVSCTRCDAFCYWNGHTTAHVKHPYWCNAATGRRLEEMNGPVTLRNTLLVQCCYQELMAIALGNLRHSLKFGQSAGGCL